MAIRERQQSSTTYPFLFFMASSTDHIAGLTGATVTVTLSKNGGSFGAASGAITEVGSGWYSLSGNATDRNTLGTLLLHATATGADPTDEKYTIVPYDPFDGAGLGLTRLDAAITSRQPSGPVSLASLDTMIVHNGTAQAGTAGSITLTSGASATDNLYTGSVVSIYSGAGIGQTRVITAYNGTTKVATVGRNWTVTPDNTSIYKVLGLAAPKVNDNLEVIASSVTNDVGITQSGADKVWNTTSRTLSAFGFSVTVGTNNDKSGYSLSSAGVQAVWDALTSALTTTGSVGKRIADNLDATISSRSTYAGGAVSSVTNPITVGTNNDKTGYGLSAAAVQTVWDALTSALTTTGSIGKRIADNLDATVSSRLSTTNYTAPDNTDVLAVKAKTDQLVFTNANKVDASIPAVTSDVQAGLTAQGYTTTRAGYLDTLNGLVSAIFNTLTSTLTTAGSFGKLVADNLNATVSSRLASSGYTAPDNTSIVAVKAKTDSLAFGTANRVDATALAVSDKAGYTLTTGERIAIATAILTIDWSGITGEAAASVLNALRFQRNHWTISGNTLIVYKEDGTTIAWQRQLATTAGASPVTGFN